ncbi:MAG: SPOR domain-containing protein [Thiohalocapsa sp.]
MTTRDYRKGAPPRTRKRQEPRGTCAFWFLVGSLLGGFGVGIAWMMSDQPAATLTAEQTDAAQSPDAQRPDYDFYSMLPEEQVVVPAERQAEPVALPAPGQDPAIPPAARQQSPAQVAKATPPAPTPSTGANTYILQVASFRKSGDAERLKAQLAMLGIQTSIQTVTIASGQTYHRVRTSSYTKADANALKSRLKGNGHDAMMMRAR